MKSDCAPNYCMAEVEQTGKMNQVKLTSGENPTKLFEQIKAIDIQFSHLTNALTEDVKNAAVLEKDWPNTELYWQTLQELREQDSRITLSKQ